MRLRALLVVSIGLAALGASCKRAAPEERPGAAFVAPATTEALDYDGELDEVVWFRAARSGDFVDAGAMARPFSEVRVAWSRDALYLALYAGDENIQAPARPDAPSLATDDVFVVHIDALDGRSLARVVLTATGEAKDDVTHAARPDIRVGHDADGTIDDPADDDEEWVLEAAIPFASLGLEATAGTSFALAVERCDTTKAKERRCGSFATTVTLGRER